MNNSQLVCRSPSSISRNVLVVDDEPQVGQLVAEWFRLQGWKSSVACGGAEALGLLASPTEFDLVVTDMNMPGMSGIDLLRELRTRAPGLGTIVLSGQNDAPLAVSALKLGAHDYVLKPVDFKQLSRVVEGLLEERQTLAVGGPSGLITETDGETRFQLREETEGALLALSSALDAREHESQRHSLRVSNFGVRLAEALGLSQHERDVVQRGGLLHDIGKIGIPDIILLKPGPLTPEERDQMQKHPQIGFALVTRVDHLRHLGAMVVSHHERYDGTGYPQGLRGNEIPLLARLLSVVDCFDSITAERPYRAARNYAVAAKELERWAGSQFDPDLVEAFLRVPQSEWVRLRETSDERSALVRV